MDSFCHSLLYEIDVCHSREALGAGGLYAPQLLVDLAVRGPVLAAASPSCAPPGLPLFADVVRVGCGSGPLCVDLDHGKDGVVAGGFPCPSRFERLVVDNLRGLDGAVMCSPSFRDGRPTVVLSEVDLIGLLKPMHLTLVGKFPAARPKWVDVNQYFSGLKLRGEFKITNLDARHMYIYLQHMDDYIRIFSKQYQYINGFLIKILKWTLEFDVKTETSFSPMWISLPLLGLHLYNLDMLFSIASVFGRPLRLDYATGQWSRPSNARILVEMDLRKQHSNEVWIGCESIGYVQKVCFENPPEYYSHCRQIGYGDDNCFRLFPELRKNQFQKRKSSLEQQSIVDRANCVQVNMVGVAGDFLVGNGSSLDAEEHSTQGVDVGTVCNLRNCVSVDVGSIGSELDISPRSGIPVP